MDPVGGVEIQPSELAKLLVIIALAKFLSDRPEHISRLRFVLLSLLIPLVQATLVLLSRTWDGEHLSRDLARDGLCRRDTNTGTC